MRGHSKRENREVLLVSVVIRWQLHPTSERSENASGGKSDMNADRNSDESIVPATSANNEEHLRCQEPLIDMFQLSANLRCWSIMGRPKRAAKGGLIYHVLNRANARMTIFEEDDDYIAFESVLAEAVARGCPESVSGL